MNGKEGAFSRPLRMSMKKKRRDLKSGASLYAVFACSMAIAVC
jgi:hypothetical protein